MTYVGRIAVLGGLPAERPSGASLVEQRANGFGVLDVEIVEGGGPAEVVALGVADSEAADGV